MNRVCKEELENFEMIDISANDSTNYVNELDNVVNFSSEMEIENGENGQQIAGSKNVELEIEEMDDWFQFSIAEVLEFEVDEEEDDDSFSFNDALQLGSIVRPT